MLSRTPRRKQPVFSRTFKVLALTALAVLCLVWISIVVLGSSQTRAQEVRANRLKLDRVFGNVDSESIPVSDATSTTILVGMASYRDNECHKTIIDAYDNADFPERLSWGVFEQIMEGNDTNCFHFDHICPGRVVCDYLDNIKVKSVDWMEAKGPTWGRHEAEKMMGDEEFYLQVDAHTRFVPKWDTKMVGMWQSVGNEYAVMSTYPKAVGALASGTSICAICKTGFAKSLFEMVKHEACRLMTIPAHYEGRPLLVPYWGAGLSFSKSHRVKNVPYDCCAPMLFDGEEFSLAARMWTHGYDFYAPSEDLVFHQYASTIKRPKYWEVDWGKRYKVNGRSAQRVNALLGAPIKNVASGQVNTTGIGLGEKYGLGEQRTLQQYYEFTGVDILNKTAVDMCPVTKNGNLKRVDYERKPTVVRPSSGPFEPPFRTEPLYPSLFD